MHKPTTPGMASPTPEEKRAHEDRHLNRKGKRAKKSREKKARRVKAKAIPAPLLARIELLTRLCRAQAEDLAQARRELRGAKARLSVVYEAWEKAGHGNANALHAAADAAAKQASLPHPDDSKTEIRAGLRPPTDPKVDT